MTVSHGARCVTLVAAAALLAACGGADGGDAAGSDAQASTDPMTDAPAGAVMPSWMPGEIYLPDDFTPTGSREIGTRTFMLTGTSAMSTEDLMTTYRTRLEAAGFDVPPADRMASDEPYIPFNGNGLESAGMRISDNGSLREITIDFSLEMQ